MDPRRIPHWGVAVVVLGIAGCQSSPRQQLRAALIREYGPAAVPTVGFRADSTHLFVLFDGPPFKPLADSLVAGRQREVARFALAHYPAASVLDSITVVFNEREGVIASSPEHTESGRFAVADLRR